MATFTTQFLSTTSVLRRKNISTFAASALLLAVSIWTFFGLWRVFFQQDEWNGFGKVIYAHMYGYSSLIRLSGSHLTPFSALFMAFLYNTFGLHAALFAWYSILVHAINGILVYLLARRMLKSNVFGVVAALLFITNRVSQQAVTWYAASMAILPATMLILLALLCFEEYLKRERIKFLLCTIFLILVSVGFRENGVFVFAYIPLRAFLVHKKLLLRVLLGSAFATIPFLIVRFFPGLVLSPTHVAYAHTEPQLSAFGSNALKMFATGVPQLIATSTEISAAATGFMQRWMLQFLISDFQTFVNNGVVPIAQLGIWVGLVAGVYYLIRHTSKAGSAVLYSLVSFVLLSFTPFFLLPSGLTLESRHFYMPVFGFSIFLAYVAQYLYRKGRMWAIYILAIMGVLLIYANISAVRQEIHVQQGRSEQRISFLSQLLSFYPQLPKKSMMFYQGDEFPFQSGPGQMFLVIYHKDHTFETLLNENYLWGIKSEGYKEEKSSGFGYFTDYALLQKAYCENHMTSDQVFSVSWNYKTATLRDMSTDIRSLLTCPSSL